MLLVSASQAGQSYSLKRLLRLTWTHNIKTFMLPSGRSRLHYAAKDNAILCCRLLEVN